MGIWLIYAVLAVVGILLAFVFLRYLKVTIHVIIVVGKVLGLAIVAFVIVYALGIWRPNLSPLLWLISKIGALLGFLS
jgi:hypothetical protein